MFAAGISKASPITGHWLLQLGFREYYQHRRKDDENTESLSSLKNQRQSTGLLRFQASNSSMVHVSVYIPPFLGDVTCIFSNPSSPRPHRCQTLRNWWTVLETFSIPWFLQRNRPRTCHDCFLWSFIQYICMHFTRPACEETKLVVSSVPSRLQITPVIRFKAEIQTERMKI